MYLFLQKTFRSPILLGCGQDRGQCVEEFCTAQPGLLDHNSIDIWTQYNREQIQDLE